MVAGRPTSHGSRFGKKIFVFGSNLAGRHGAGSALEAFLHHGAIKGRGIGLQGNSYAIPTKDEYLKILPLDEIEIYVKEFLEFARKRGDFRFNVVAVGTGLAGYRDEEVGPFFKGAPGNVSFAKAEWEEFR